MRNYSLKTLEKQLETAERKRYELIMKPDIGWGYGMRHNKLPSTAPLDRLDERIKLLKRQISEKKGVDK